MKHSLSRTQNTARNVAVAIVCQILNLILQFTTRTFFVNALGAEYLGLNGLFSNILLVLSFAELGIGNAIIFSMYKPLATGNEKKLSSLMALYKKAYTVIGIVIAVAGVAVVPVLGFIIKEQPDIRENISIIYLLFLANTVASYFFAYKKSIITADQKNYIVLLFTEVFHLVQSVAQILILCYTGNYILYLLIQISCTFLCSFCLSLWANKTYPFLKGKAEPLSKEETSSIFEKVRALVVYKFGSVILNGTDNILVSSFIGVREVGLVSNYVMLYGACGALLSKIMESFTASIGNLNAIGTLEQQKRVFNKVFLISTWLYSFATLGLIFYSNRFISLWVGESYVLDSAVVIAIMLGFYVNNAHFAVFTYRTTLGYFTHGKIAPLIAAIINIVLSIILCKWIGLAGIFIATPISRILTTGVVDPFLIFKRHFHSNPLQYYLVYILYGVLYAVVGLLCYFVVSYLTLPGWIGFFVQVVCFTVLYNGVLVLIFSPLRVFKELMQSFRSLVSKRIPGKK